MERDAATASPRQTAGSDAGAPRPDVASAGLRVAILGTKGSGKTYLFHAMVFRALDGRDAGVLSYYIENDAVMVESAVLGGEEVAENLIDFLQPYRSGIPLEPTKAMDQKRYRLRLGYRLGYRGQRRAAMDVHFFDGSGEQLSMQLNPEVLELWDQMIVDAGVLVFCMPAWVAFPRRGWVTTHERHAQLLGFEAVVNNYRQAKERTTRSTPIPHSILALTMADDHRCALASLQSKWILPFLDKNNLGLPSLRKASVLGQYLSDAARVSRILDQELASSEDRMLKGLVRRLDFGKGAPWLIPMSAINGASLERFRSEINSSEDAGQQQAEPIPVHVELPLLVALCERFNALM